MYNWVITFGYEPIVVATKADKIARGQWEKHLKIIREELGVKNRNTVVPFSSSKKLNIEKLWEILTPHLVTEEIQEE